jgi:hypothetical protein
MRGCASICLQALGASKGCRMRGKDPKKVLGARARSDALTAEDRKAIASKAAQSRWDKANDIPRAQHTGTLNIGTVSFPCSVLTDGTRILTQSDFMEGMGMYYSGWVANNPAPSDGTTEMPHFLAFRGLRPFVDKHLGDLKSIIVKYRTERGAIAHGIRAEIIPKICDVWIDADENINLGKRQKNIASKARLLMRSLAHVGIISLVDEATGYQKIRARDELQKILAAYISPELLPWAKRFPDAFYEELHRVRGWQYKPGSNARNAYIGKLTRALIYDPLPPGVIEELERKNPYDPEKKRRKHLHHRLLTETIGHPHLEKQIVSVTTLLRISDDWDAFSRHFSKAFPPGPGDLFAILPPSSGEDAEPAP